MDLDSKPLINELQRLIILYRKKKQMSYIDLSSSTGISKIMLMKYEKDEDAVIPIQKLLKIMKAVDVPKEHIIQAIKLYY